MSEVIKYKAGGLKPSLPVILFSDYDALRIELEQCGAMASMIENKEWAEHAGTGPVSSRVESAFTQLHNELSELRDSYESMRDRKNSIVDLQKRLTIAEQRADVLEVLVEEGFAAIPSQQGYDGLLARMLAALKPAEEGDQSKSGFTKKTWKSARAPIGLKKDQIVEVFGGGQTQIARVDKTDWRHVEMWRIKP